MNRGVAEFILIKNFQSGFIFLFLFSTLIYLFHYFRFILDASNESNSRSSSEGVFRSSRSTNPIIRSGVLRPSVLGPSLGCNNVSSSTKTKTTESTHEGKSTVLANNPFLKEPNEEFENENESEDGPGTSRTSKNKSNEDTKKADDEKEEVYLYLLIVNSLLKKCFCYFSAPIHYYY